MVVAIPIGPWSSLNLKVLRFIPAKVCGTDRGNKRHCMETLKPLVRT